MRRTIPSGSERRIAFSLLELLVVLSIIVVLIGLSVAIYGNIMNNARHAATMATITKLEKLLQQQITAWGIEYRNSPEIRQASGAFSGLTNSTRGREALALKAFYRVHFPQTVTEAAGFDGTVGTNDDGAAFRAWLSSNTPTPQADSSELLYLALTNGKFRNASPVDVDSFTGNELDDTDDDGFPEVVDAWGNPLRFYRWPTRLLHPFGFVGRPLTAGVATGATSLNVTSGGGAQIQSVLSNMGAGSVFVNVGREVMQLISVSGDTLTVMRGAQSTNQEQHPAGALVKLSPFPDLLTIVFGSLNSSAVAHDPDDPTGSLLNVAAPAAFETSFHTLDSFHTPLIVSAGSDETLGLYEPSDVANFGYLAAPDTTGGVYTTITDPGNSPLADNLTNQREGTGN